MKLIAVLTVVLVGLMSSAVGAAEAPVRFAMVGLTHDHAHGFIPGAISRPDIQLVGILEPNQALAARYAKRYQLNTNLFHNALDEMLDRTKPQAVAIFTSTFDHLRILEACAARGIHVMMEKPLAVSLKHARAMASAAKKGGIQVVVNYETTWYPANHAAYALIREQRAIGDIRKVVVHDGHRGPKEIGCSTEFLDWLTDPVLNGGGAMTDFGCYGADLITWLMDGQRPISVLAIAQHIKPDVYPKVEDEATLLLTYPKAQGIIQASWNWPFDRKDMEIYGQTGYILAPRRDLLKVRQANAQESDVPVPPLTAPNNDSLSYLAAVVRGEIRPSGLSSLEVNLIVTEILDAARKSSQTGKKVNLPPK
jgi:predicted dehydrogenase